MVLTNITYKPEERPFFIIVTPGTTPMLLVPKLEFSHVRKGVMAYELASYWEYPALAGSNWFDLLNDLIGRHKRVGIERNALADVVDRIQADELVLDNLVEVQRKVKSAYELERIRASARICDEAMADIFKTVYRGASVLEPFTLSRSVQTNLIRTKQFDPITTSLLTAVWNVPTTATCSSTCKTRERQRFATCERARLRPPSMRRPVPIWASTDCSTSAASHRARCRLSQS